MSRSVVDAVERWLEQVVVGLNLCPFAAPVLRAGGIRVAVGEGETPEAGVELALREAVRLLDGEEPEVSTTLVALPRGVESFEVFLDVVATVEAALEDAGAAGVTGILRARTSPGSNRLRGPFGSRPIPGSRIRCRHVGGAEGRSGRRPALRRRRPADLALR